MRTKRACSSSTMPCSMRRWSSVRSSNGLIVFLFLPETIDTARTPLLSASCRTLKPSIFTPMEPVSVVSPATIQSAAAAT